MARNDARRGRANTAARSPAAHRDAHRERRRGTLLWRLILGGGILGVLAAALLMTRSNPATGDASCAGAGITTGLTAGQCAPTFTLSDIQGHAVSLTSFRSYPVLLHFWAVGCTTCAAEYPDFARAVQAYEPKGLKVVAVDAWGEPASLVHGWQSSHHLPATLLIDPPQAVVRQYQVPGTPTTFFINRTGHIVSSNAGPLAYADFQRALTGLLAS